MNLQCHNSGVHLTFLDTVKFILEKNSNEIDVNDPPALIINLDDAQRLGDSLQHALRILVMPILTDNRRVFVPITGACEAKLMNVVHRSRISIFALTLPLLTDDHMSEILKICSTFMRFEKHFFIM